MLKMMEKKHNDMGGGGGGGRELIDRTAWFTRLQYHKSRICTMRIQY